MSFPQQVYEILVAEAARRMITLQELLRAIIVPEWILEQKELDEKPFKSSIESVLVHH